MSGSSRTFRRVSDDRSVQPHDGLFRLVFGSPVHARGAIRALVPELAARLDLDRLTVLNGTFVDAELSRRHSDVCLSTYLDGHEALVYFLLEHQSGPDPLMPWRMLRYVVRVWERHVTEHPKSTRLPLVLPIVVHQGVRPWSTPTELRDLIDVDPFTAQAVEEYLPRFRFRLEDMGSVDPAHMRALLDARPFTPLGKISLFLLRDARGNPDLDVALEEWLDVLDRARRAPDGTEMLPAVFQYIVLASETPVDRLRKVVARLGPEVEENLMTTADMLRAEGRVEGEATGRAQGRAETLTQLLTQKFGPLPDWAVANLQAASSERLESWTGRVLTATTIDEIFA
jgi:predicted transposase/invertase (TIGR01784 family)